MYPFIPCGEYPQLPLGYRKGEYTITHYVLPVPTVLRDGGMGSM